jgi:hypothetical protein
LVVYLFDRYGSKLPVYRGSQLRPNLGAKRKKSVLKRTWRLERPKLGAFADVPRRRL